ncbi:MAG TPA: hypothetical protein VH331_02160 [Allosphingosinicella sp.]|jgi:hypothetical protein|nr:hypothetical protein [Allosphingosinicella sp.]
MAKGKDKDKKDKGKKADKGVKIPKPLRKAGKEALKLAKEPAVAEIVAAALLSAAAALRGDKAAAKAGKQGAEAAADAGRQATKIGDSLRTLAVDLARRTLDNWENPAPAKGGSGKGKKSGGKAE